MTPPLIFTHTPEHPYPNDFVIISLLTPPPGSDSKFSFLPFHEFGSTCDGVQEVVHVDRVHEYTRVDTVIDQ